MLGKNKFYFLGALACVCLWAILYYSLVFSSQEARENESTAAKGDLEGWLKYYQRKGEGASATIPLPEALQKLDDEKAILVSSIDTLKKIEFAQELPQYTKKDIGGEDPNNYFDKKRREVWKLAESSLKLRFQPGLDDLGFSEKFYQDPVPLNLARLFVLKRFFEVASLCGVKDVDSIQWQQVVVEESGQGAEERTPEQQVVETGMGEEKRPSQKLFLVPLIVRLRAGEKAFVLLLAELQRPSDKNRSYFCLRGVLTAVKEESRGAIEVQVGVAAIFPEEQFLKGLQIPHEDKKQGVVGPLVRPELDPSRY